MDKLHNLSVQQYQYQNSSPNGAESMFLSLYTFIAYFVNILIHRCLETVVKRLFEFTVVKRGRLKLLTNKIEANQLKILPPPQSHCS